MSTMATRNWNSNRGAVATAIALPSQDGSRSVREMLIAARDTVVVVVIQLAFRATMMLRRWNY